MEQASVLYQLKENTPIQMMSYVIQTKSGELFVVDGGNTKDAEYLLRFLYQIQGEKPLVTGWFLTHAHADHINAFIEIIKHCLEKIQINTLYLNFPEREFIAANENSDVYTIDAFQALNLKDNVKTVIMQEGDSFHFQDASFDVLYTTDAAFTANAINNSSTVLRLNTQGVKVLFLADLGVEAGKKLLKTYGTELKSDVVQMAHHGQSGVEKSVYEAVCPSLCLWPTPQWLWENDQGKGPGTGPWKTQEVRNWMDELGVKNHLITKDGTGCVSFSQGIISTGFIPEEPKMENGEK